MALQCTLDYLNLLKLLTAIFWHVMPIGQIRGLLDGLLCPMKYILVGTSSFSIISVVFGIAMHFDTLDTVAGVATLLDSLIPIHVSTWGWP